MLTPRFIIYDLYPSMFRCNPYQRKMRTWLLQGMAEEKDFIGDMRESTVRASRGVQTERRGEGKVREKGKRAMRGAQVGQNGRLL